MARDTRQSEKLLKLATRDVASSKHLAVWKWLEPCPLFPDLYFAFSDAENSDVVLTPDQIISPQSSTTDNVVTSYIDRTFVRLYDFVLSVYLPYTIEGNTTENVGWANIVEGLAEWVEQQNEIKNFPLFGEGNSVQSVEVLALPEGISARDEEGAKYMFGVRFEYRDETKKITL